MFSLRVIVAFLPAVLCMAAMVSAVRVQTPITRADLSHHNRRPFTDNITIPRACAGEYANMPFCNVSLSIDDRVDLLIGLLKLDEKPPLLTARESPKGNVPRLGLPEYDWGANCLHGVQSRCGTRCPTSFPSPNALGASWNMSAVKEMGEIIGWEMRSLWLQGVGENHANDLPHIGLDCWSPNININRDPRWGRNQEVPSEDPYINGLYGVAYTKGLQEGKADPNYLQAVVTLKHWDAYSLEDWENYTRHNFDAKVSAYDLADTYFPAFKASVVEGKAKGVMCSYNALNGIPTCASSFLNNIIRNEWGFDGYITSDSGAISDIWQQHKYVSTGPEAVAKAVIDGGCDVNSGSVYLDNMTVAIQQGILSESQVDLALKHTLKLRFELGLFDPIEKQPYWHVPPDVVNTPETQAINLRMTQESLTLLRNEDNILPLARGKSIAMIGPHANATQVMVGNYLGQICPGGQTDFSCVTSPLTAMTNANTGGSVTYAQGCTVSGTDTSGIAPAVAAAQSADIVLLFLGLDQTVERESHDRTSISLPGVQPQLTDEIIAANPNTIIVLFNGGMVALDELKTQPPGLIEAFYPGYQGGAALASVIFGDYNPGGKLPITIYNSDYINQVSMGDMSMTNPPGRSYRYYTGKPTYEFGFGLSYSQFQLVVQCTPSPNCVGGQDLILHTEDDEFITVEISVQNQGPYAGDEVVQAYWKPANTTTPLRKQLFNFERVSLAVNEQKTVTFKTSLNTFALTQHDGSRVLKSGDYHLLITNGNTQQQTIKMTIVGEDVVVDSRIEM